MLGGNVITADHWSAGIVAKGSNALHDAARAKRASSRRRSHPDAVTFCASIWRFGTHGVPFFVRDAKQAQCPSLATRWAAASVLGSIANVLGSASEADIPKKRRMMLMLSEYPAFRPVIACKRRKPTGRFHPAAKVRCPLNGRQLSGLLQGWLNDRYAGAFPSGAFRP